MKILNESKSDDSLLSSVDFETFFFFSRHILVILMTLSLKD